MERRQANVQVHFPLYYVGRLDPDTPSKLDRKINCNGRLADKVSSIRAFGLPALVRYGTARQHQ